MKLISIDGASVVGKDRKDVVSMINTIESAVKFVLAKPVPGAALPASKGSAKKDN